MKKAILLLVLTVFAVQLMAQKKISLSESNENIGNGKNNALIVTIYEASASDIEKEWKSIMKDFNAKVSSKKEIFADDATIKAIGPNTVDVYARVEDNKNGSVKFIVGFDLGGAYLSSSQHSSEFKEAKNIVYNFAVKVSKEAVEAVVKEAEKLQKKNEKDLESLVKDKGSLEKDIETYKSKIQAAEADIQKNLKAQEAKKKEVDAQKVVLSDLEKKIKAIN
ncbi:MAG: hypothetical protein H0V01_00545 [Bacteroidetes bacterium]|nr:hypothetical protein [Bacteroidota bacterium]HET6245635.1 hypothetical protein [Bacteroidia bacterium]